MDYSVHTDLIIRMQKRPLMPSGCRHLKIFQKDET